MITFLLILGYIVVAVGLAFVFGVIKERNQLLDNNYIRGIGRRSTDFLSKFDREGLEFLQAFTFVWPLEVAIVPLGILLFKFVDFVSPLPKKVAQRLIEPKPARLIKPVKTKVVEAGPYRTEPKVCNSCGTDLIDGEYHIPPFKGF